MESINIHNYEAFWLDYIEGNLDEQATEQLMAFLEKHPELKPDLFAFDLPELEAEDIKFGDKHLLMHSQDEAEEKVVHYLDNALTAAEKTAFEKELQQSPFLQQLLNEYKNTILPKEHLHFGNSVLLKKTAVPEETLIAYAENQLSAADKTALEKTLQQDEVAVLQLELIRKTINEPDYSVTYPDKSELKREAKVIALFNYRSIISIAAAVVLLFGIFWLIPDNSTKAIEKTNGSLALKTIKPELIKNSTEALVKKDSIIINNNSYPRKNNKQQIQPVKNTTELNEAPLIANTPTINPKKEVIENPTPREESAMSLIAINPYNENDLDPVQKTTVKSEPNTTEMLARQINKAAWGEDEENEKTSDGKKKIKAFDVLALIGKGLKKMGNQRSDAKKVENEDNTQYIVTIGSLSVTRKAAN